MKVEVGEEWRAETLLCLGGVPDGYCGDEEPGPWRLHPNLGMCTDNDVPYRWTLCPECGCFGAKFWGFAERLPCQCIDDRERSKVDNSADQRLLDAYRAAEEEPLVHLETGKPARGLEDGPVARESLVRQEGAASASARCTGQCRSVGEQLRADLPEGAHQELEDADALCDACPGFVCIACGEEPAAAAGAACQVCEPVVRITYRRARALLNTKAAEVAGLAGREAREINTLINRALKVRRRAESSLAQLGEGLALVEGWLEEPTSLPQDGVLRKPVPEETLEKLHGKELRSELREWVGPLASAAREPIPSVQMRLNYAMGVATRAEADDEQLRDGVRQAQAWVADPASYRADARSAEVKPEPGGLPAPMRTKQAVQDSSCNLCTSPVAAGELIGRLHAPGQYRFAPMGWLCAHCLHERRAKPRRLDVVLRIFHSIFVGEGAHLNVPEAEVLLRWLLDAPDAGETDHEALQEAYVSLQHGIGEEDPAMLLRDQSAQAVVRALRRAPAGAEETAPETAVRDAVAQHMAEWRENPEGLEKEKYTHPRHWRRAILENTSQPTVLSARGGPFCI